MSTPEPQYLLKLNAEQRQAVIHEGGPLLILAGAGSGKTRVITTKIAWLVDQRGESPRSILAVTFTNKAASEMAERVDKILGHSSLAKPLLSTFHSFCVRVLRRDIEALRVNNSGLTRNFAIYDEVDQQAVVKIALKRLAIDDKSLKPRVALGRISWAKNHMIDPQEYFLASTNPMEEKIAHIFEIYRKELFKANALDFDDLLLETVRLLKVVPEVRERYNRRYKYLLIDEYQDTNRPQYELMKLLAGPAHNVCVVGDEDQSIYSWRGADIKNILEFEKDFPEVRTIRLEQNYRSTQSSSKAHPPWSRTTPSVRARRCSPRARAARSSATTRLPTARMKRSSSPTASSNISARPEPAIPTPFRDAPSCTAPTRSPGW